VEDLVIVAALVAGVVAGPWLARVAARLATRDETARADWLVVVLVTVAFTGLLVGAALVTGPRPATVAFAVSSAIAAVSPEALGFGDVKLLGLLGLVLGWFGWGTLLAGVFLGLLTGAVVSLALLATRRAGWRTALPFGPPLLLGAVLALALLPAS
jgi:leader peptidase (prepilin peptidase)/N-methyltransferase